MPWWLWLVAFWVWLWLMYLVWDETVAMFEEILATLRKLKRWGPACLLWRRPPVHSVKERRLESTLRVRSDTHVTKPFSRVPGYANRGLIVEECGFVPESSRILRNGDLPEGQLTTLAGTHPHPAICSSEPDLRHGSPPTCEPRQKTHPEIFWLKKGGR